MKFFRLALCAAFLLSCQSFLPKPVPLLFPQLVQTNESFHNNLKRCQALPKAAEESPTCKKEYILKKAQEVRNLAKAFLAQEQPANRHFQGYDIYLNATSILFSIAVTNLNDYSEARRIAREFFENQKAKGVAHPEKASLYLIYFTTQELAAKQDRGDKFSAGDKENLKLALNLCNYFLTKIEDADTKVLLMQHKLILEYLENFNGLVD